MLKEVTTKVDTEKKYESLKDQLRQLDGAVVALSGGVDSSFLAKVCSEVMGDKVMAATIVSPMLASRELEDAKSVAAQIGIEHVLLEEDSIDPVVGQNSADRCYHCKKIEFGTILTMAKEKGYDAVLDGSNADDTKDYRPGAKAVRELSVISPLQVAELTKSEIRNLSKRLGLSTWNKPAYACLASRIPYGDEITREKLSRVEKAEAYLHTLGYHGVRVRVHDTMARIELNPDDRIHFCNPATMDKVSRQFKTYGFLYVCLELEGYAMGSLNRQLEQ